MSTTDEVFTPKLLSPGQLELTVPTGWEQGRATFGGLVVAGCVRAMQHHVVAKGEQRWLRTLSAELVGAPVPGPAQIATRVIRESKTVSTVQAELSQNGEVQTHVVGVFGDPRFYQGSWRHLPTRQRPAWRDVEPLEMDAPFAPNFARHFEYRPTSGIPFSGDKPAASGFIRPRNRGALRDAAYIAALADAWWLAAMVGLSEPRPAATLSFSLDLHDHMIGLDADAPLFHYAETVALTDGYGSEVRELWGEDGRLVAINRQIITIVK